MQVSPDGKRVAFVSGRSGTTEIWVCDSDGKNPLPLTSLGHDAVYFPSWSPDGRFIAFESDLAGKNDIYVMSADGGQPRRLTTDASHEGSPSWSRDGRWIYFASDRGGDSQLWKVHPEGGEAVQVTRDGGWFALESRDGRYVYYQKEGDVRGLWRMPVDGDAEESVFEKFPSFPICPGRWALADDGVYFCDTAMTGNVIKFYNFATRRVTQIATGRWLTGIALSPDARWLLYANWDRWENNIVVVENVAS
jgi:Tol biopolymer transport system component